MRDVAPPGRPWAGRMRWCDLAFLHWPVDPAVLRAKVPRGLEIDTFHGEAWVGIVPFRMEGVRLRATPPVPTVTQFPEINVRTYVRAAGRAGVWFFSLDAASRLAVRGARLLYNLPYFDATIDVRRKAAVDRAGHRQGDDVNDWVHYDSRRVHRRAPSALFAAQYRADSDPYAAAPGTLEHFLVERYCLFAADRRGALGVIDVDHEPWPLQRGCATVTLNTMARASGITLPEAPPLVHVAATLDVRAWHRRPLEP